jgi:hypothetical protein
VSLSYTFTGRASYQPDSPAECHPLVVAVECRIGAFPNPVLALLDTASEWCVLPAAIAEELGCSTEPADLVYLTRLGQLPGRWHRIPVLFPASVGVTLEVEATWLALSNWSGPAVIGWKGCLERMRFALDPRENSFCFADASEPLAATRREARRGERAPRRRGG